MAKVCLVTGSAIGIGRAIIREMAAAGCDVVINYLTSFAEAEDLKKEVIEKYHVRAMSVCCDVSSEEEVNQMLLLIEKELGGVDILVNNAAVDLSNMFHEKNISDFKKTMDVNVIGAFNVARRVYKHMLEKKWGRIINISSTNGINTYYPVCLEYDASKAALNSLTHNLAIQFAPYINVNAVAPGFIGTENELKGYDEEFLKQEEEKILLNRYGREEEVAHVVKFLASEEASYINNTIIRVDGGQYGS